MKTTSRRLLPLAAVLVAACASLPSGPSDMALPGSGRSFDQFRGDDANCRHYASHQVGGTTAEQAQTDSVVRSAAAGALIGALAGAAIDGGHGAGVGAGTGMIFGALAGSGTSGASAYGAQRRYDQAYVQCMYGAGHRVPVYGRLTESSRPAGSPYSSLPPGVPPPPPGSPPPPPPR